MNARKDNVDLICNIAELAGLFQRSSSLDDFLQTVVNTVAWHMKAAVCSIYLLEKQSETLVLRANQGLNPEVVGRVTLKLGEGITGTALKEMRAICEGRGSRNPHFKYIPGSLEEQFEAFLAVPILRGLNRIGVLVVQDGQPNYFDDNDAKALRAIATQLATTIENAGLLISIRGEADTDPSTQTAERPRENFIRVQSASKGLAAGRAVVMGSPVKDALLGFEKSRRRLGREDFDQALAETERQIEDLQTRLGDAHEDIATLIFSAHLLMLKDTSFSGEMQRLIDEETLSAEKAVIQVVDRYTRLFEASRNERLREKVQDVKDLGHRLLHNLLVRDSATHDYDGQILVAEELLPSDIVKFSAQRVEGIVLSSGGITSHVSILAQSLSLPMVLCRDGSGALIKEGTSLLVDANQGTLFVDPDQQVLDTYRPLLEAQARETDFAGLAPETHTRDGVRVHLLANINLLSDLVIAENVLAEGVGLYRSEFPFIIRNDFPSEEEQFRIYRRVLEATAGREAVFRTLDIGGDKMLSYFPSVNKDNPFLGLRAIRFTLRHRDIFGQQLRAMLRAGAGAELRIMFPLISSVDDFVQARAVVLECIAELCAEGIACNDSPRLGVMVEMPSIVEVIDEICREADFLCIGTNDLVQYMLAVDRTNEEVSHMYLQHHPAVLRVLKRIADAARRNGTPLSICGELAADGSLLPFLLGIGLRHFSVNPRHIPFLQTALAGMDTAESEARAKTLLGLGRIDQIEDLLRQPA